MNRYHIEFITPLFSRGAYDDVPEIRPASIRGQLHWWFRALGGTYAATYAAEKEVFGGVHDGATASKVVVRVADLPTRPNPPSFLPTLPHKTGGRDPRNAPNAPRCAFPAGTRFTLVLDERLGGCPEAHRELLDHTIHAWLLAGSLGLRTTRGGGSFHWEGAPMESEAYCQRLSDLLAGSELRFDLLRLVFDQPEDARRVVTETISHRAFPDLHYPLGAVRQGPQDPAPSRKTSPLRLTVRRFADGFRILAVWDGRQSVTGNTAVHLKSAIERLANGTGQSNPTQLGTLLRESSLA